MEAEEQNEKVAKWWKVVEYHEYECGTQLGKIASRDGMFQPESFESFFHTHKVSNHVQDDTHPNR